MTRIQHVIKKIQQKLSPSVRVECNGKVLRLFPDEAAAQLRIELLARGALERFQSMQHESGLGWLIKDKESGRLFDDAGIIQ